MPDINDIAGDYTVKLGIAPSVAGFDRFREAVAYCVTSEETRSMKYICERIGEKRFMQGKTVQREIGYAVKTADNLSGRIYDLLGLKVREEDIRPKYIIRLVAFFVKRELGLKE